MALQKKGSNLFGGRGRLTNAAHRTSERAEPRKYSGCAALGHAWCEIRIYLRTLKRWWKAYLDSDEGRDQRKGSPRRMFQRLSDEEHQGILLVYNQKECASLQPGQLVPIVGDWGDYIGLKQPLPGGLHRRQAAPAKISKANKGTKTGTTAHGCRWEPALELGDF